MADLYTLTTPLLVRYPDGEQRLIADKYMHPHGMIYAEPYWLESESPRAYLIKGTIKGEGPWKIGDVIVRLLSCGDTEEAMQWANWQQHLMSVYESHRYGDESFKKSIIDKMSFAD